MIIAEVAARAVTYLSAMLLFGASAFVLYSPRPSHGDADAVDWHEWQALRSRARDLQLACVVATVVAGLLWLVIHASAVVGVSFTQAAYWGAAGKVVRETLFGRALALRLGLAAPLAAMLVVRSSIVNARSPVRGDAISATLSAAVLASLAWMGHAAATPGFDGHVHLGADVLHLLAAGAWLGALPLLALILIRAGQRQSPEVDDIAVHATKRFSPVGVACVSALVLTGGVNAWYLVATPAALFGTVYGQLLLLKLALFALMLVLAGRNRFVLTPRIQEVVRGRTDLGRVAVRRLARNAWIEATLGIAIVVIVGWLGISVPGAHAEISWPLPFALHLDALEMDPRRDYAVSELILVVLILVVLLGAGFALYWFRRERITAGLVATVMATAAFTLFGYLFSVPAHPTTYVRPPVRYTTATIAAGATLYRSNCATCHGADGQGGGPAAASLPVPPANLTSGHALRHLPGDLYWQITHGISGTPMPGFESRLTPQQIWQLVVFLHANAQAQEARRLSSRVRAWHPIVAPDFPFEVNSGEQETLEEQRGQHAVLLVLCPSPDSSSRLIAFSRARDTLESTGIRVLAISCGEQRTTRSTPDRIDQNILATSDESVAATYTMLLAALSDARWGLQWRYAEILIDRDGYVRSIQTDQGQDAADRLVELKQDAAELAREPRHPPPSHSHGR